MGIYIIDQYSLLHFASGVIAYFWQISLKNTIIFNIVFEIVENSEHVVKFIHNNFKFWPGEKHKGDTFMNSTSDIIFGVIGWLCSYYLDKYVKN
jgi:hypothetical protein